MFASDLDAASRAQLARGERLTELLKQGQYDPFGFEKQVVMVWAGLHGKLDTVAVKDIRRFESEFLEYLDHKTDILSTILSTEDLSSSTEEKLESAVDTFLNAFVSNDQSLLAEVNLDVDDEPASRVQEKIVKSKAVKKAPAIKEAKADLEAKVENAQNIIDINDETEEQVEETEEVVDQSETEPTKTIEGTEKVTDTKEPKSKAKNAVKKTASKKTSTSKAKAKPVAKSASKSKKTGDK
jgi:F0F1-type ATP synthase alpha subunit